MADQILFARCTRQTLLALLMAGAAASERAETAEIAGAASKTSHRAQPGGGSSLWRGGEGGRCPPGAVTLLPLQEERWAETRGLRAGNQCRCPPARWGCFLSKACGKESGLWFPKLKSWHCAYPRGFSHLATDLLAEISAGILPECGGLAGMPCHPGGEAVFCRPLPGRALEEAAGQRGWCGKEHSSEVGCRCGAAARLLSVEAEHPLLPAAGEAGNAPAPSPEPWRCPPSR